LDELTKGSFTLTRKRARIRACSVNVSVFNEFDDSGRARIIVDTLASVVIGPGFS